MLILIKEVIKNHNIKVFKIDPEKHHMLYLKESTNKKN